ncbi:translation factor waclaw [Arctopsyche grandis]|uniref:translation factor waclaw n=1 Tax=Arctopsyche grandis TaxID=121162 RepID=UPI00406D934D
MFFKEHLLYKRLFLPLTYSRFRLVKRYCTKPNQKAIVDETSLKVPPIERIRNFSIIAHVDHGKSTLADRLLEFTGAIKSGVKNAQVLDQLQVERERGITVKAVTASLNYVYKDQNYLLNLIDTPGHVDFSNEVVRSVQVCQGAILLVDAAEGPRAQTVAVHSLATKNELTLLPVLNKIDLPRANPTKAKNQLFSLFNIEPNDVLEVSAKKGWGVENLVHSLIERIPPPNVSRDGPVKALVFDTWHDKYRGILCLAYIESGYLKLGDSVKWLSLNKINSVKHLFLLTPEEKEIRRAGAGQVVVFGCGPRGGGAVGDILLSSDTVTSHLKSKFEPNKLRHMVYAGIFPMSQSEYTNVQSAMNKLAMNDAGATISDDSSPALGQGWRIGFSGLLHMEVFTQRLFQEYKAEAIISAPSVPFKFRINQPKLIKKYGGEIITITNPCMMPAHTDIVEYFEPFVVGTIVTPIKYLGSLTALCLDHRGIPLNTTPLDEENISLQFRLPLSEILVEFHDIIKSITSGYANFDYNDDEYYSSPLAKVEILLNGEKVDELISIVHVSRVDYYGRRLVEKLKEKIPRQMVQIAIQATVNNKVIARETLQAYRKDVTAKLYGGDVTRRMKLLKQQADGKKQMRIETRIRIPRETLIEVLRKK